MQTDTLGAGFLDKAPPCVSLDPTIREHGKMFLRKKAFKDDVYEGCAGLGASTKGPKSAVPKPRLEAVPLAATVIFGKELLPKSNTVDLHRVADGISAAGKPSGVRLWRNAWEEKVEKIAEVEKIIDVEKIVGVEKVIEVEKTVEVEKIVEAVNTPQKPTDESDSLASSTTASSASASAASSSKTASLKKAPSSKASRSRTSVVSGSQAEKPRWR
jgi:hypothetical protein